MIVLVSSCGIHLEMGKLHSKHGKWKSLGRSDVELSAGNGAAGMASTSGGSCRARVL